MKMKGHSCEYADKIVDLFKLLRKSKFLGWLLRKPTCLEEAHNLDLVKLQRNYHHALTLSHNLRSKIYELVFWPSRLLDDHEPDK